MPDLKSQDVEKLIRSAINARDQAYAPHSHFYVGAAILMHDGEIVVGCNVENASFGLTQCAERSALTAAVCAGEKPGSLVGLVLYIPGERVHPPCGACRQVMRELMSEDSTVHSCCDTDEVRSWHASDYLPDPFTPENLAR